MCVWRCSVSAGSDGDDDVRTVLGRKRERDRKLRSDGTRFEAIGTREEKIQDEMSVSLQQYGRN